MNMDVTALIAAAGQGTRLGLGPKAFLELGGISLLERVQATASEVAGEIKVAVPAGSETRARALLPSPVDIRAGADTRQGTFASLLETVRTDWVLLLDIARPLLSTGLCRRVLAAARATGAAGAYVPALVPCAQVDADGRVRSAIPASDYQLPQMPQAFRTDLLRDVFMRAAAAGLKRQTVWQLAVELGLPLQAVPGEADNIKITEPIDWRLAQAILNAGVTDP